MNTLVSREVRNSEVLLYLYSTLVCQRLLSVQKIYQMPTPANACTSMQFIAKTFLPTNATPTNACTSMQFIAKTFLPTNAHTSKCLHQHAIHCQNIFTNKCPHQQMPAPACNSLPKHFYQQMPHQQMPHANHGCLELVEWNSGMEQWNEL